MGGSQGEDSQKNLAARLDEEMDILIDAMLCPLCCYNGYIHSNSNSLQEGGSEPQRKLGASLVPQLLHHEHLEDGGLV